MDGTWVRSLTSGNPSDKHRLRNRNEFIALLCSLAAELQTIYIN